MKKAKTRCAVTRKGGESARRKTFSGSRRRQRRRGRQGEVNENVIEVKRSIDLTCTLRSVLPCSPCSTIPFSRTSSFIACLSPSLCACVCRCLVWTCALCVCPIVLRKEFVKQLSNLFDVSFKKLTHTRTHMHARTRTHVISVRGRREGV